MTAITLHYASGLVQSVGTNLSRYVLMRTFPKDDHQMTWIWRKTAPDQFHNPSICSFSDTIDNQAYGVLVTNQ